MEKLVRFYYERTRTIFLYRPRNSYFWAYNE